MPERPAPDAPASAHDGPGEEGCRRAAPDDVPRVVALAQRLSDEAQALKGGALWSRREARPAPLDGAYRALLDRADACLLVGTLGEVVVGFGAAEIERLRDGTSLGVVSDLYVEPEARAVGVGEALAGALLAFCQDHGCVGVDARALPGDRATKNFFEAQGFTARALVMHRSLQPPARGSG